MPINVDSNNQVTTVINSFLNEEKEKAKRRLNLIIHNIPESTDGDGLTRKKHDIDFIISAFQQYLGVNATINKAFRLGQRGSKPRLLKISVNTETEKASILQNRIKLKNDVHPEEIQKIFITPDVIPKEQEVNKKLRDELKELNKEGRIYYIKMAK